MPRDQRDSRALDFAINGFVDGVNTLAPADMIPNNALVQAKNCIVDEAGTLTKRPAIKYIGGDVRDTGSADSLNPLALIVAGEGTKRRLFSIFFASSGATNAYSVDIWDGTWTGAGAIVATPAEVSNVTWARENNGSEYLYVTNPSSTPFKIDFPATKSSTVLTAFTTNNDDPPEDARYIINTQRRVWWAGTDDDNRNILYYSFIDTNGNENYDRSTYIYEIGTGTGQAITGLAPFRERAIFIGMESSCFLLFTGTDPNQGDWDLTTVSMDVGVGSHKTIVNVAEDLYFMDQHGQIRSLSQLSNAGVRGLPISIGIKDRLEAIKFSEIYKANACFYRGHYWLSFPLEAGGWEMWAYNVSLGKWYGPQTFATVDGDDLAIYAMATTAATPGTARATGRDSIMYMMAYDGQLDNSTPQVVQLNYTETDDLGSTTPAEDAVTIEMDVISKAYDFNVPNVEKSWEHIEIWFQDASAAEGAFFSVEGRVDFGDWIELGKVEYTRCHEIKAKKLPIPTGTQGRVFQFRIKDSSTAARPKIHRAIITARMLQADGVSFNAGISQSISASL